MKVRQETDSTPICVTRLPLREPWQGHVRQVYAKNVGLDVDTMLKSISTGAASSVQMNNVASRALQDDYRPGFFIKHFIKDMNLADEEARAADTELKVLEDVLSMYKELEQEGMGELGTQALIKYYNW